MIIYNTIMMFLCMLFFWIFIETYALKLKFVGMKNYEFGIRELIICKIVLMENNAEAECEKFCMTRWHYEIHRAEVYEMSFINIIKHLYNNSDLFFKMPEYGEKSVNDYYIEKGYGKYLKHMEN